MRKVKIFLAVIALMISSVTLSYAAFPVSNNENVITMSAPAGPASSETRVTERDNSMPVAPTVPAPGNSGKSQLAAALLCFFLGGLGIHRFYLGYTWQGVVQLLTGGGCGIWALIDFIRILTGDLQPKNGSYSKTL